MTTPSIDQDRLAEIKKIVCETLELDPDEVTETSLFAQEHGADSLGAIEVLAALERTYDITIDQSAMAEMTNLQGVYSVVARSASW